MSEHRIAQQLEACRPGHPEDLALPEIAEAAGALEANPDLAACHRELQAWDARCAEAMQQIPVPAGLAARLLSRLAEKPGAERQLQVLSRSLPAWKKRTVFSVLGAAAMLFVAITISWLQARSPLTAENWRESAERWYEQVRQLDASHWHSLASLPAGYPVSQQVLARPRSWVHFANSVDPSAVAYDCTPPGSREDVTLLVFQGEILGLGAEPPQNPYFTQGRSMAAWQSGGLVYMLVVEGGDQRYRSLIDSSPAPLAMRSESAPAELASPALTGTAGKFNAIFLACGQVAAGVRN